MTNSTDAEILFAIPFDQTLYVDSTLLGAVRTIEQLQYGARLEFPRIKSAGSRALRPPISAPTEITQFLPDGLWGINDDSQQNTEIEAVLVVVPVSAKFPNNLVGHQVGGEKLQSILQTVSDWFDSFSHWLWVLTAQSLDPVNPDPKVIHRRSRNVIVTASAAGQSSIPSNGSPIIRINVYRGSASERLVNTTVLDAALQAAGNSPPMTLELLASARMAARRFDRRRALIDAGTAAEAALSCVLSLNAGHKKTLGGLVTLAQRRQVAIPSDTNVSLVEPRNDAVHRGLLGAGINIDRALEVAEEIVALAEPSLIRVTTLAAVHRPQRHDFGVIKLGNKSDKAKP